MSRDIDQRVVQIEFDNKEFEKNIAVTQKSLDKLSESLDFDDESESFDKLEKNSKKVKFTALQSAVTEVHNKFNLLESAAKRVVENIVDDTWYAAKQVVSSMSSITNFKSGWNLYEQITTSVQTLTTAMKEGTSEADKFRIAQSKVNQASWFSDETNSDVKDMIKYMSMFLNKGFTSDEAMTTIMGISTLAASVGRAPAEASHAMLQLSQVGEYMNKQDWNSIKNLNMDTVDFKQAMLDAGVAAGTLVKVGDAYYKTGKKISEVVGETYVNGKKVIDSGESASSSLAITVDNFEQTLAKGAWATPKVLQMALDTYGGAANEIYKIYEELGEEITTTEIMRTLEKEADEFLVEFINTNERFRSENGIVETFESIKDISDETQASAKELMTVLGQLPLAYTDSFKYMQKAQEAKTLTEALDSVRTAVQKKWYQIFENIFGTYDMQRTLWTNISEQLWEIFVDPLESMLQVFKDADLANFGRDELDDNMSYVEGIIYNIIDIFGNLKGAIIGAFQAIFPPKTEEDYKNLVVRVYELTEKLKDNQTLLSKISSVVRGLIKIVVNPLKTIGKIAKTIASSFTTVFKSIFPEKNKADEALGITKFEEFADKLKISDDALQKIGNTATKIFSKVKEFWNMKISQKVGSISSLLSTATEKLRSFFGALKNGKKDVEEGSETNGEETIFDKLKNGLEKFKNGLVDFFETTNKWLKDHNVLETVAMIAFIALLITTMIAMIKLSLRVSNLMENLSGILYEVQRSVAGFRRILNSVAAVIYGISFIEFAIGLGILALVISFIIKKTNEINKDGNLKSTLITFGSIVIALAAIASAIGLLSKNVKFGSITGLSLLLITVVLIMSAISKAKFNATSISMFVIALGTIVLILSVLVTSLRSYGNSVVRSSQLIGIAAMFVGISIMLTTIASVYKKLSKVIETDPNKFYAIEEFLNQYLIMAAIITLIAGKVGSYAMDGAVLILALGVSVALVAKATEELSNCNTEKITAASRTIFAILGIMGVIALVGIALEKLPRKSSSLTSFDGANMAAMMIGLSASFFLIAKAFDYVANNIGKKYKKKIWTAVGVITVLMIAFATTIAIVSNNSTNILNTSKATSTVFALAVFFGTVYLLIRSLIVLDDDKYAKAINFTYNLVYLIAALAFTIASTSISSISGVFGLVAIIAAVTLMVYAMVKFSEMLFESNGVAAFKAMAPLVKDLIMYVGAFAALFAIISAIKSVYKLVYPEEKKKEEKTKKQKDPFNAKEFWSIVGGIALLTAAAGALIYASAEASKIVSQSNSWIEVLVLIGSSLLFVASLFLLTKALIKQVEGNKGLVEITSKQILSLAVLVGSILASLALIIFTISQGAQNIKSSGSTLQAVLLIASMIIIFELVIKEIISLTEAASKKSMTGSYMMNIIFGMISVIFSLIGLISILAIASGYIKSTGSMGEFIGIVITIGILFAEIALMMRYVMSETKDIKDISEAFVAISIALSLLTFIFGAIAVMMSGTGTSIRTFVAVAGVMAAALVLLIVGLVHAANKLQDSSKLYDIGLALIGIGAGLSILILVSGVIATLIKKLNIFNEFIAAMIAMAAMFIIFATAAGILSKAKADTTLISLGSSILSAGAGIAAGALGIGVAIALVVGSVAAFNNSVARLIELLILAMESEKNLEEVGRRLSDALIDIAVGFSGELAARAWEIGESIGRVVGAIWIIVMNVVGGLVVAMLDSISLFLVEYWPKIKLSIKKILPNIVKFVRDLFELAFSTPMGEEYDNWRIDAKWTVIDTLSDFGYLVLGSVATIVDFILAGCQGIIDIFNFLASSIWAVMRQPFDNIGKSWENLIDLISGKKTIRQFMSDFLGYTVTGFKGFEDIGNKIISNWDNLLYSLENNGDTASWYFKKQIEQMHKQADREVEINKSNELTEAYFKQQNEKKDLEMNFVGMTDSEAEKAGANATSNFMKGATSSLVSAVDNMFDKDNENNLIDKLSGVFSKVGGWFGAANGDPGSQEDVNNNSKKTGESALSSLVEGIKKRASELGIWDENEDKIKIDVSAVFDPNSLQDSLNGFDLGSVKIGETTVGDMFSSMQSSQLASEAGSLFDYSVGGSSDVATAEAGENGTVNIYNTYNINGSDLSKEEIAEEIMRLQEEDYQKYGRARGEIALIS